MAFHDFGDVTAEQAAALEAYELRSDAFLEMMGVSYFDETEGVFDAP